MSESQIKYGLGRFRGRSEHTIDAKGRLNMPVRFRDVLMRSYDEQLMLTPVWNSCVRVYPFQEWEKWETKLLEMPNKPPEIMRMIRFLVGGITPCCLDKNGRILLPANLRAELGIEKDIVMNGMLNFFEIWSKETWDEESVPSGEEQNKFVDVFNDLGLY